MHVFFFFSFEEIAETCVPKGSAVQLVLTSGARFLLYTHRANQIHTMIEKYCLDNEKVGKGLHKFFGSQIGDGFVAVDNSGLDKENVLFSTQVFSMNFSQKFGYPDQSSMIHPVSLMWLVGWFVMPHF
jgi:hypothetical protein